MPKHIFLHNNDGWEFASRDSKNYEHQQIHAVVIVAKHVDNNKLVVIKQYRKPIKDFIYELPAGLIDPGETPEKAAIRELKEETGLDTVRINGTITYTFPCVGLTNECQAIVFCDVCGDTTKEHNVHEEDIESYLMSLNQLNELVWQNKAVIDSKLAMLASLFVLGNQ